MKLLFLDDPNISNIVFYPRKTRIPENLPDNIRPLTFQIDEEIKIGGICYLKDENLPSILMFHGNGEIALDYSYFYESYFDCDVNLTVADFRGYGFSTGKPIYSVLIDDAMPIYNQFIDWINENGLNNSIFVKGRSLGSVCAAEIGSHNPKDVRGIIFESGFASIYKLMTDLFRIQGPEITKEILAPYSNDIRIKRFQKPTLVIHGTADWIISVEQGKLIYSTIPEGVEKELILIEGAGHNNIFSYDVEYFVPLKKFIQKHK
jgi:pimeloyl-ACP methyl ester carboxylesterase